MELNCICAQNGEQLSLHGGDGVEARSSHDDMKDSGEGTGTIGVGQKPRAQHVT